MLTPEQINRTRDIVAGHDSAKTLAAAATEGERAICLLRELLAAADSPGGQRIQPTAAPAVAPTDAAFFNEFDGVTVCAPNCGEVAREVKPRLYLVTSPAQKYGQG
jgi:hypothetical protein